MGAADTSVIMKTIILLLLIVTTILSAIGCNNHYLYNHKREEHSMESKVPIHVDRIINIVEFRILDDKQVYLRTDRHQKLDRITADGGLFDDRHYINGAGEFKEAPNARAPSEIVITIGESMMQANPHGDSNMLRLIKTEKSKAVFHHTGLRRNGEKINRMISVSPYTE